MDESVRDTRAVKSQEGLKIVGTEDALAMGAETAAARKDLATAKAAAAQAQADFVEAQRMATLSRVRLREGRDATVFLARELNHGRIAKLPAGYAHPSETELFDFTRSLVTNFADDAELAPAIGVLGSVRGQAVVDQAQEVSTKQRHADWTRRVTLAEGRLEVAIVAGDNHIRANTPKGSAARKAIKREVAKSGDGGKDKKQAKQDSGEPVPVSGTPAIAA